VQDRPILDPARHLRQYEVVPRAIEEARQIKIDHPCLVVDDRLGHPCYRLLSFSLWAVPIRPVVQVGLEDRLRDEP
jgi:hypothetical protein